MTWPCLLLTLGLLRVSLFALCCLFLCGCSCQSSAIPCLLVCWLGSFPQCLFLQLWIVGHGEFPRSVFSLGCMRVCHFPQFSVVGISLFWATSLVVDFRAVDSALVSLSSHLNLSSPAFFSLACWLARLFSLGIWLFCDACMLPWKRFVLVYTCPLCGSCLRHFLFWLASWSTFGAHAWGGFPPWLVALVGSCPPSVRVGLAVPRLCFSLHHPCALFDSWCQVFLWVC